MDGNTTPSDFVLQWGNGKRLRCMKFQIKDPSTSKESSGSGRTMTRLDRRVIRSDPKKDPNSHRLDLRQQPVSPSHRHRVLRNSESSISMRGHSNGAKIFISPDRGDKKGGTVNKNSNIISNHQNAQRQGTGSGCSGSSETAQEGKKVSYLAGSEGINAVWLPKFVIPLTNKEKEEDFMAIKGSKLPQRPKKRAKFVQRTVNLVCPGSWLCDLTLERYEVREKKISKKRPRGLKDMGNMDSDSE
ncbi:hypothetical protein F511_14321 [Dorcoceras hygrometricum]|uniref:Uncharacterized protein n=1 Tax=Dorcoceras hygrometricum TaxID=472368 RepID=A0A2Z7C5L5_9LAMI|nr:hypothetical protein F511_14321 [Dorcoceras hygrometricum]